MEEQGLELPNLPDEVWELIFEHCDDKMLYIIFPLVSKLFRKLLHDEGGFWQRGCARKKLDLTSKSEYKSWKQVYRYNIRLFPFFGITIRQSTFEQLLSLRKKRILTSYDDKIKCVIIDHVIVIWCRLSENGKLHCVSGVTGLKRRHPMPA
jgi:hypothetical protein